MLNSHWRHKQQVAFGDKNFEVVNEFVYLRALVTPKNGSGFGDTAKISNRKWVLLQPAKTTAVISPGT
jgi:hypothetical protein